MKAGPGVPGPAFYLLIFNRAVDLLDVFAQAALSHHLIQEILDDHQKEEHLALLPARHAGQHLQQLRINLLRERQTVREFRHLR